MKKHPITHLIIDTSSSNEYDNGGCDYCLVQMTAEYVVYLLDYMDEVSRLHRADNGIYAIKCWDAGPRCFRGNDKFQDLRDVDGALAADIPPGEPILLTADPQFVEEDYQRVDCQTVQVSNDDVWWTAYVKHTGIRIDSAHVEKKTLLRIQRSLGASKKARRQAIAKQPREGSHCRTWKCPDCGRNVEHSYEALAEVGSPTCPHCDIEMELL